MGGWGTKPKDVIAEPSQSLPPTLTLARVCYFVCCLMRGQKRTDFANLERVVRESALGSYLKDSQGSQRVIEYHYS